MLRQPDCVIRAHSYGTPHESSTRRPWLSVSQTVTDYGAFTELQWTGGGLRAPAHETRQGQRDLAQDGEACGNEICLCSSADGTDSSQEDWRRDRQKI
jgi:hypothetical protein